MKLLDLTHHKDRQNRWTRVFINALRERMLVVDPMQRRTLFNWCYCGALQDLYDSAGNRTHWDRDIGGRVIAKQFADGSQQTYAYDLAGRQTSLTDAENQTTQIRYAAKIDRREWRQESGRSGGYDTDKGVGEVLAGLRAAATAVPKRDVGVSGDLVGGCWETLLSWGGSARGGAPTGKESPTLIPCRGEVRDACPFFVNSPNYFKLTKTM